MSCTTPTTNREKMVAHYVQQLPLRIITWWLRWWLSCPKTGATSTLRPLSSQLRSVKDMGQPHLSDVYLVQNSSHTNCKKIAFPNPVMLPGCANPAKTIFIGGKTYLNCRPTFRVGRPLHPVDSDQMRLAAWWPNDSRVHNCIKQTHT